MATKVRVNLANAQELLELPGPGTAQVAAIVRFRSEHGPIKDADQLATIFHQTVELEIRAPLGALDDVLEVGGDLAVPPGSPAPTLK